MEQILLSEYPGLYCSTKEDPNSIRVCVRLRDLIDPAALRAALDITMTRYPYLCVELRRRESGEWVFAENRRPVTLAHGAAGAELNAPETNFHMLAFFWHDNWLGVDAFHALTDGAGVYEVLRTLLYYYCTKRYGVTLSAEGVRLAGEPIPESEWRDPLETLEAALPPAAPALKTALDMVAEGALARDCAKTVYSVAVPEEAFLRLSSSSDGSPATMAALFLSRALARLFPDGQGAIRIGMYANWKPALHAREARQSLVGPLLLDYADKLRAWPVDRQATAYRGMVFAQMREDAALARLAAEKDFACRLRGCPSEEERLALLDSAARAGAGRYCASVSYVGKANLGEAERYIRDFRTYTCTTTSPVLVEISAVNGRFRLDVIQRFSAPLLVEALLAEFEEHGVAYDLQDVGELRLANVRLPWSE